MGVIFNLVRLPGLLVLIGSFVLSVSASADDLQPMFVKITETAEGRFILKVQPSPSVAEPQSAELLAPCQRVEPRSIEGGAQWVPGSMYDCPVATSQIALRRSATALSPTALVRFEPRSGGLEIFHLPPGQQQLRIGRADSVGSTFAQYLGFGFQHILGGFDHLLFVLCLILLAGSLPRILLMITGFTAAHSLTLGLSVLELVVVPVRVVEVLIALSIVMLATEIVRLYPKSWLYRYPVLVSSLFGLLHGLGFAAAMKSIGLPKEELFSALLAFNIGVELGQILFVLCLLLIFGLIKKRAWVTQGYWRRARVGLSYGIGGLSSYWFFTRLWQWLGASLLGA